MADFSRLACAAAPAFDWSEDAVLAAIEDNRVDAVATVIEADGVAVAIQAIARQGSWEGSATELLAKINGLVAPEVQRERDWPKDGTRLSTRLRRAAPALRRTGVNLTLPENGGRAGRTITIVPQNREKQRSRHRRSSEGWQLTHNAPFPRNADEEGPRSANQLTDKGRNARNADSPALVQDGDVMEGEGNCPGTPLGVPR